MFFIAQHGVKIQEYDWFKTVPYLQPTPMALRLPRVLVGAAVLLWSLPPRHCFNLEAREALVIPFPGQQQDRSPYFGIALALQKQRDDPAARLIVGAPRANSSTFEPGIKEPGAVFRCSLDGLKCDELKMDPDYGNGNYRQTYGRKTYKNYKPGGWVGGAMDSQPIYQSDQQASTAVCSPRWVNTLYSYYESYQMNGICYRFNQTLPTEPQKMMPLTVPGKQVYRSRYHYYHGQVGFSVHFTNNSDEMILGAPGVTNWRGSVVRARNSAPRFSRRRQNTAGSFSDYFVPNMYDSSSIEAFDLLGYAVTSGYYLDPRELLYGAGAPKAGKGNGKAIIFSYPLQESSGLLVRQEMVGSQMGSNFGASLTTLDINGDGLSDLVVGAPTYIHQGRPDVGRVVVFLSSKDGLLEQGTTAYHGSSSMGARFGTTVAAIGDLNGDQYEDFVVGAPFEGNGAIYVILGSGSGLPLTHSQRLGAEAFPGVALRGFGMALSRGVDVDDNAYPDVAIGSFLSGHAVVVKSRPIARLITTLTTNPSTLQLTTSNVVVSACIHFTGTATPRQIAINGVITLDPEFNRALFSSDNNNIHNFTEILTRGQEKCLPKPVSIRNLRMFPHEPIVLMVDLQLMELTSQSLIEQAVADPSTIQRVVSRVNIATGCEVFRNKTCRTDMRLEANFDKYKPQKKFLVGGGEKVKVKMSVFNTDEPAFLPILLVDVDSPLALFLPSSTVCSFPEADNTQRTSLVCQLANPIHKENKDTVEVELDTSQLTDSLSSVDVRMKVTAQGLEVSPQDTQHSLTLGLAAEASVRLHGYSYEEEIRYRLDQHGNLDSNETQSVQHSFSVVKEGSTPVRQVLLDINIPVRFQNGQIFTSIFYPTVLFSGQPVQCQLQGANFTIEDSDAETMNSLDDDAPLPASDDGGGGGDGSGQRNKRSATLMEPEKLRMGDSALDLTCSEALVECAQLTCRIGPWPGVSTVAEIAVKLSFNFTVLAKHKGITNMGAFFRTSATASIHSLHSDLAFTGNRTAMGIITTHLQPVSPMGSGIAWWIILLAVLGGILLLALLACGMYKAGFFRRKKLEEMKAIKQEDELENNSG
ncbi:hypothetical protein Pmani_015803 [Petrolisthes manimaculis]|uniref:Integrin alpha-2 domain-containing protein n=1 Tax=Petrolisthes manimaculis TaxID=1843537 RepID=A0AAE1PRL1_9EUCA|nr:hypothetical protein Pmani_015803 [Petrolisthes manimaculis]